MGGARPARLQAAAERAPARRGQRRRAARPVGAPARRPRRARARRGRVRGERSSAPTELELRVQEHGGRRTFVSTGGRLPARAAPAARLARGAARERRRLRLAELHLLADDPRRRRGARRPARASSARRARRDRRDARAVPAGRAAGPAGAPRRAPRLRRVVDSSLGGGLTYEAAGVSLAKADAVVERLRAAVESTGAQGFGAFAGLHPLDDGRLLAASTDGVGTKLILARERGALRACGADLAAHCINDVITTGAEPLFLLDYVAANRIDLEQVAELVEGAAEVCRAAGCALVGGETAELPGIYREDELDFAGTCVGIVERDRARRRLAGRARATSSSASRPPACTRTASRSSGRVLEERTTTATTCSRRRGSTSTTCGGCATRDVRALAHVTGGGIVGNLARVAPRRARRARSTGTRGSGRPCSTGSPGTSRRRSCGASSTSGSATARSSPPPGPSGSLIGRSSRVIGVLVSGEGTNLQALIDAGLPIAARRVEPARRARARARRGGGIPTGVFPLDELREPRGARRGDGGLARRARRRAGRLRRLHAAAAPAVPRPLPRARRQRPPRPPAAVPGPAGRSRTRSRRACARRARRSTSSTRASTAGP